MYHGSGVFATSVPSTMKDVRCSNGDEPIGVVKYRVELIVLDTSGKIIFVLLDEDTTKLIINMTATKLLDSQIPAGCNEDGEYEPTSETSERQIKKACTIDTN
ncbi:unnamed protein product [Arabidopsis halleri]